MNENNFRNSEFENILKEKIDELASSVDCFDKISSKAFPEERKEYSDSEYTICDLENITGKKRGFRFLPAAVMAVAAVVCIAVIPKNSFVNSFLAKISGADKKVYRELINEINEETADGDYLYFDCTLDEYIANDIHITPLYSCPFEQSGKDDINVRIFVKMYGNLPTNQIYAVQYEGDYDEANYIAAADSKAKFTDEELESKCSDVAVPCIRDDAFEVVEKNFASEDDRYLVTDGAFATYVSSFSYDCLYKYGDTIYPLANEVIVNTRKGTLELFEYDYLSMYIDEQNEAQMFDTTAFADSWDNVVYYNGSSAEAKESSSAFTKTNIVSEVELTGVFDSSVTYIDPFISADIGTDTDEKHLCLYSSDERCGYAQIPLNPVLRASFRMYTRYTDERYALTFEDASDLTALDYSLLSGNIEEVQALKNASIRYKNGFIETSSESDGTNCHQELLSELTCLSIEEARLNLELDELYAEKSALTAQDEKYDALMLEIEDILRQTEEIKNIKSAVQAQLES